MVTELAYRGAHRKEIAEKPGQLGRRRDVPVLEAASIITLGVPLKILD